MWSLSPKICECANVPTSAGSSSVGTCRHCRYFFSFVFLTRFPLNCLYFPSPLIQWRATALSSQQWAFLRGSPSKASFTLSTRLVTICPDISFGQGIVSPFLARRDFAVPRPVVMPEVPLLHKLPLRLRCR